MSYRHSSYRKLKRAAARLGQDGPHLRSDVQRIVHWANFRTPHPRLFEGDDWGVPRKRRRVAGL